jgi:preprotein translocase subunit SecF
LLIVGAFIMGAVTLQEFAVALTVGMLAGAYSSVFVAAPVLVALKERESKYKAIRERLQSQGVDVTRSAERVGLTGAGSPAIAVTATPSSADSADKSAPVASPSGMIPPRPRKNQRKR